MNPNLYIGLISGTSMDAVDCALVDFSDTPPNVIDFINIDIPPTLKSKILDLCQPSSTNQIQTFGEADTELGKLFSKSVIDILSRNQLSANQITAIGSHGQTVRHQPSPTDSPFSLQIGDPNCISQLTGITTVADFRRKDIAAGGQGAPLVPAFHKEIFYNKSQDRIILNIGGISNITILKKDGLNISGFDTGPGNVLMDIWIKKHQNKDYDHNGEWSNSGQCSQLLLSQLLCDPYFQLPSPKSTGRELFNQPWLEQQIKQLKSSLLPEDIQATLLNFTACSIRDSINALQLAGELIVCGGGARNGQLIERLKIELPQFDVMPSSSIGINVDSVEALAFAWFAKQTIENKPIDLRQITGSSNPLILGGIYLKE